MVEFRTLDLMGPWPGLQTMDIVFLRNALIHFDRETKQTIFERVRKKMRDDGCVMLGAAEGSTAREIAAELEISLAALGWNLAGLKG